MFVVTSKLPQTLRHVFYEKLNALLAEHQFDANLEVLCQPDYDTALWAIQIVTCKASEVHSRARGNAFAFRGPNQTVRLTQAIRIKITC